VQAAIGVTGSPQALVATGSTLWVANSSDTAAGNNVTPIDVATLVAGSPVLTPAGPSAIALSPDGTTAYVVCNRAGSLVALDLATAKLDATRATAIAGGPYALALASVPAAQLSSALGIVATHKASTSH
jgi:DNA-binding beta-propeller fold protein YncE